MASPSEAVFLSLARAEDAVSRLDERVRRCGFQRGWLGRLDYAEASAWSWNSGEIVAVEDLVLHDLEMDVRTPDLALRATHAVLRARRRSAGGGGELFSTTGMAWLAGARKNPPGPEAGMRRAPIVPDPADLDRPDLLDRLAKQLHVLSQGTTEVVDDGVLEWLDVLLSYERDTPALLQAALALEAWSLIDPLPRQKYLGPLLVSHWLRERRRVDTHLLGLETGIRVHARSRRRSFATAPMARLAYWLQVIEDGAAQCLEEMRRLELARQVMAQHAVGRRAHSRLPDAINLLLEHPAVSAPVFAERMRVSQTTARRLLETLGSSVKEITGRTRGRVWRV